MRLVALAVALACLAAPQAHAQWLTQTGNSGLADMGIVQYESPDWALCTGQREGTPNQAISACGRIIGERYSLYHTGGAHYFRGLLYRGQGNEERALRDLRRSLEITTQLARSEPANLEHLHNRIAVRRELGDTAGMLQDYALIAAASPDDVGARIRVAQMRFGAGDYPGAARDFDAIASEHPDSAAAQSGRCEARAAAGVELEIAREACDAGVQLSHGAADAHFSRGFFLFQQGDLDAAMRSFVAAGEKDPSHALAAYGYAVVVLRGGENARARELLEQAQAANPDTQHYANAGMRP